MLTSSSFVPVEYKDKLKSWKSYSAKVCTPLKYLKALSKKWFNLNECYSTFTADVSKQ